MNKYLTQEDKDEIFLDSCDAFHDGIICEQEFRKTLVDLGYNATDVEEEVRLNAPGK